MSLHDGEWRFPRELCYHRPSMAEPPPSDRPARPPPLPTLPRRPPDGSPQAQPSLPPLTPPRGRPPLAPDDALASSSSSALGTPTPPPPASAAVPTAIGDDDGEGEGAETTRPVQTPNAAALVDELVELVSNEAEALLTNGGGVADADERLADLNVRLSLVTWDVLEDAEDAARYLELA